MKYNLQITYDDYKEALRLHMMPRAGFRIILYCLLGFFFLGFLVLSFRFFQGNSNWQFYLIVGIVLCLLVFFYGYLPFRWKKTYNQQKVFHQALQYEFAKESFVALSEFGNSRLPWNMFHKWKEGKRMFLIYQPNASFHIIPKRIFQKKEEEHTLRNILLELIGRPIT